MGLKAPSRQRLRKAVKCLIETNRIKNAALRLNVFKQKRGLGLFVFSRKLKAAHPLGFRVVLFKEERIAASVLNSVKSLNRYFYSRLSLAARQKGFDEALFLNSRGEVVEGARTNIFLVKDCVLFTPKVSCGCLPGVTRKEVLRLAKILKIPAQEKKILPQELKSADEIFLTNSLIGVMPVVALDKKPVGKAKLGVVTDKIKKAYQKEVVKACGLG
jgi:branched-subunit amino acid aminotransferase/4-amino-4-deoxychorismate lyase